MAVRIPMDLMAPMDPIPLMDPLVLMGPILLRSTPLICPLIVHTANRPILPIINPTALHPRITVVVVGTLSGIRMLLNM
ncbi:unnamed protein product [Strongylus vulgaris]|uniref:Uncharacterized protein n=1 Tax=Strongylus vulgaris TaxID=40348 RepID=A0A3P7JJT5_STRVU|nr:unnamed protein product [Strongylus vulgaris]